MPCNDSIRRLDFTRGPTTRCGDRQRGEGFHCTALVSEKARDYPAYDTAGPKRPRNVQIHVSRFVRSVRHGSVRLHLLATDSCFDADTYRPGPILPCRAKSAALASRDDADALRLPADVRRPCFAEFLPFSLYAPDFLLFQAAFSPTSSGFVWPSA